MQSHSPLSPPHDLLLELSASELTALWGFLRQRWFFSIACQKRIAWWIRPHSRTAVGRTATGASTITPWRRSIAPFSEKDASSTSWHSDVLMRCCLMASPTLARIGFRCGSHPGHRQSFFRAAWIERCAEMVAGDEPSQVVHLCQSRAAEVRPAGVFRFGERLGAPSRPRRKPWHCAPRQSQRRSTSPPHTADASSHRVSSICGT